MAWSITGRRMGYVYCPYHGKSIKYLPAAVATAVAETGIEFRWFGRITTTRRPMYVIQVPTDVGYDLLWCIPKSQVNSTRSYGAAVGNSRKNRPAKFKEHVNCECESESWDASVIINMHAYLVASRYATWDIGKKLYFYPLVVGNMKTQGKEETAPEGRKGRENGGIEPLKWQQISPPTPNPGIEPRVPTEPVA
jgi:hypothetical protein